MTKAPNQQTPARDKTVEASKMLCWLIPHWAPGSQWGFGNLNCNMVNRIVLEWGAGQWQVDAGTMVQPRRRPIAWGWGRI